MCYSLWRTFVNIPNTQYNKHRSYRCVTFYIRFKNKPKNMIWLRVSKWQNQKTNENRGGGEEEKRYCVIFIDKVQIPMRKRVTLSCHREKCYILSKNSKRNRLHLCELVRNSFASVRHIKARDLQMKEDKCRCISCRIKNDRPTTKRFNISWFNFTIQRFWFLFSQLRYI